MKLSQMTTDQAADVLVRIAEPAANLMHDDEMLAVIQRLAESDGSNALKFISDNLVAVTGVLLGSHKHDVYEILAALSGKDEATISGQKITDTIRDIRDCWDGDLLGFFGSLKG